MATMTVLAPVLSTGRRRREDECRRRLPHGRLLCMILFAVMLSGLSASGAWAATGSCGGVFVTHTGPEFFGMVSVGQSSCTSVAGNWADLGGEAAVVASLPPLPFTFPQCPDPTTIVFNV